MRQFVIALDQTLNTILGGWADETISARVYRNQYNSWWWKFWLIAIDTLFFWQHHHCAKAYNSEVLRKQFPEAYRI